MRYYVHHEDRDDPLLEWATDEEVEELLARTNPRELGRISVEGYLEDEYDSDGVNKCLAAVSGRKALSRFEGGIAPVQLEDS